MIYPIAIFDLIASLASLAALSILLRGWKRALQSGSKLLLTGTLVFILSYNLCHFLEWSGITKVLETIENLFGALIPMWWAFFLYALLKEAAERDLRMSEEKFSKAFRSSPVLMAVTRLADGHIVDVNESFADSLGYSREEAIGKTTLELNIWADPEQRKVFTEKFKERGQVSSIETQIRTKSGEIRLMSLSGESIDFKGKPHLITIAEDITEGRKAAEALQREQKILEDVFETTLAGYWDWRIQDDEEYLSPTFKRMFGYDDHELPNKPETWQSLIFQEDLPGVFDVFERHVKSYGEIPFYNEVRYRHKNGSTIWVICAGRMIEWGPNGEPIRMVGCHVDITERKKAAEALKKEEAEFRLMLNSSPIIVFFKGREGRFIRVNKVFAEALDMPEEKFVGKTVFDLYSDDIARKMTNDDQQVLESGKPKLNIIEQYESKQGKRWVQTDKIPTFDVNGKVIGLIGFAQDITERKKAEDKLKTSEKNYRSLFEGAPDGIIVADMETGQYIHVNLSICKKLGYTEKEIKDLSGFRGIHPKEEEDRIKDLFYRQAKGEIDIAEDIPFVRKDGTLLYFDVASVHVEFDGVKRVVGLLRDITERKKAERRQNLRLDLLKIFHQKAPLEDMCGEVVSLIKEHLNSEVVAIRLKKGEDYPYFANDGFPESFIEKEKYLCVHDEEGDVVKDRQGRPVLACMCGAVINSMYDAERSFFTKNGSFWTNNTTDLLASTSTDDRGTTTRNTCNEAGYESVALIPIRSNSVNVGLIQINDKHRNLFGLDDIRFLEEMGHLVGIAIERKKSEEGLKTSEKNYRSLFEGAPDGIIVADMETGQYVHVNPSICKKLGYTEKEIKDLSQFRGIHPKEETDRIKDLFYRQARGEIDIAEDIPFVRKDGTLLYFDVASVHVEFDGVKRVVGLLRDITERKKSEIEFKEGEAKYKSLFDSAGDAIFIMDVSEEHGARFLECNDRTLKLFGCTSRDQILGKTPADFSPQIQPDGQASDGKAMKLAKLVIEGQPQFFEWAHHRLDGTPFWVEVFLSRIEFKGKLFMQAVVRDITERKRIDKMKDNLIRDVSHSLKTPIALTKMACDMVEKGIKSEDMDRIIKGEEIASSNSAKALKDIEGVLKMSFSEEMGRADAKKSLSLRRVFDSVIKDQEYQVKEKNLKVKVDIPKGADKVLMRARDLTLLCANIIDNAIKFTEKGGINIKAASKKDLIEIKITDTGSGIRISERGKVFERFYKRHAAVPGMGLGLAISKEIVERNDGEIEVKSKGVNKGTTVIIKLPKTPGKGGKK